jgi:polyhydroxybutyrate depolymerase
VICTLVALLGALVLGIGSAEAEPAPSRRACRASGGLMRRHLVIGGRARSYLVATPAAHRAPAPILLAFHGYSSSAATLARSSGLHDAAGAAGFVTVYPEGSGRPSRWGLPGRLSGPDDAAFVDAVVTDVAARACGDPTRVSAAGFSNGAAFVGRLACRRPGGLRAVALVGGAGLVEPCAAAKKPTSTPVVIVHGAADAVVRTGGGPVLGGALQAEPLRVAAARWQAAPARAVRVVVVPAVGHVWPSLATREIVATFAA